MKDQKFFWNTGLNPPGEYLVAQEVYYRNQVVSKDTTAFNILASIEKGRVHPG